MRREGERIETATQAQATDFLDSNARPPKLEAAVRGRGPPTA
jgi:hypothetical protein